MKLLLSLLIIICAVSQTIILEHVNIIPIDVDTILKDKHVIIRDGLITSINSNDSTLNILADTRINGRNKYLIPGFHETHFHMQNNIDDEVKLLLANGVVSVRSMGEDVNQDQIKIRNYVNSKTIAPRYVTAGTYLQRDHLKTKEDVVKIVKEHKRRGFDFIKLADDFDPEVYTLMISEAEKANIPVVGHGQRKQPLEFTLRMKSVAHVEEFMNIFTYEQCMDFSFLKKAAKQIHNSGVYVSPTLGTFEMIMRYANDKKLEQLKKEDAFSYLPKKYSDFWISKENKFRKFEWFTSEKALKRLHEELDWLKKFTKILSDEGVPLMVGSDTYGLFVAGFSIHREMELMNQAGMSPYEVLKSATLTSSRYLGIAGTNGSVREGKTANLVLLNKNPLEDIRHTKTIEGVFIKGNYLDRKAIEQMLTEVKTSVK